MVLVGDQREEGAHCSLAAVVRQAVQKNSTEAQRHRVKLFWRSSVHFGQERGVSGVSLVAV